MIRLSPFIWQVLFVPLAVLAQQGSDPYAEDRHRMVHEQIEKRGINHQPTLDAMRAVKRHLFVPREYISDAYDDGPVPIGYGQTISQPFMVGYMTSILNPDSGSKVLEIGSGSGYQAAVLAEIVDRVFTIEIIPELGEAVKKRLGKLGYENIEVKIGDGYHGWPEHGPFDAIIVTAAAGYIPPPLIKQLVDRGKMVIPVGSPFQIQTLMLVEKSGSDIKTKSLMPVRFVPFRRP